jgi:translocation protein SEC66
MEYFSLSLLFPIAYLGILIGSMATFSHLYRQRQVNSKLRLAPYFSAHTSRNIYLSLLHQQDNPDTKVPDTVLRAALFARALDDVQRMMEVRTRKPALATLLQRGVVGDEIFQRLTRAEQELQIELKDVVAEANALAPNWGQTIFQSASEMVQNRLLRERIDKVKAKLGPEKEAWENQREQSRRELEGDVVPTPTITAAPVAATPAVQQAPPQTSKAVSSDEDGVIVEPPITEATSTPTTGGGGGGGSSKNKKKKGKK